MSRVTVNVLEVNRQRLVALEGLTAALAEVVFAIDSSDAAARAGEPELLEPLREFLRALRTLLSQPLPEALMAGTAEVPVELEAPVHELEQLADELEQLADRQARDGEPFEWGGVQDELEAIAARLRHRALARS